MMILPVMPATLLEWGDIQPSTFKELREILIFIEERGDQVLMMHTQIH